MIVYSKSKIDISKKDEVIVKTDFSSGYENIYKLDTSNIKEYFGGFVLVDSNFLEEVK